MYLKEVLNYSFPLSFLLVSMLFLGCLRSTKTQSSTTFQPQQLDNTFTVPGQKLPPEFIQSIAFHKSGNRTSAPIIELGSSDQLQLKFDYLKEESKQFTVKLEHYNADWSESNLLPSNIYEASFQEVISGGLQSRTQDPAYLHFTFEFPTRDFDIKVSGNYMVEIYDGNSDQLLFELPFFVHEDEGQLRTRVQDLFSPTIRKYRKAHQLFSVYEFPDFVTIPRNNLTYYYIQNSFWGRAKEVEIFDDATPGQINFHIARERSFNATYTFYNLDLREFDADGQRIREVNEEVIPPQITLYRDVTNLDDLPNFISNSRFGQPETDRFSRYGSVQFNLDSPRGFDTNQRMFIVGDFNNWAIKEKNRMEFNPEINLWQGSAFIKQGEYTYKYVAVNEQQYRVDDVAVDDVFSGIRQNYTVFVYFEDPNKFFTRLLQFETLSAN